MRLGLWMFAEKDPDLVYTRQVAACLRGLGADCCALADQPCAALAEAFLPERFFREIDALVVLGGDGTILAAARAAAAYRVPLLGVNLGHVGFLSECGWEKMEEALALLVAGKYRIEERMMLRASLVDAAGRVLDTADALNDMTLVNVKPVHVIRVRVEDGEEPLGLYQCDGILVASPTGSTAYSLAAGGPVIPPWMPCLVLTPVCSIAMTQRPLVLPEDTRLTFRLEGTGQEGLALADGNRPLKLLPDQRLVVERSPYTTRLARVFPRSFYEILREKRGE